MILCITGDVDTERVSVISPDTGSIEKYPVPDLKEYSTCKHTRT